MTLGACDLFGDVVFDRSLRKGKIPRSAQDDKFTVIPSAARDLLFHGSNAVIFLARRCAPCEWGSDFLVPFWKVLILGI